MPGTTPPETIWTRPDRRTRGPQPQHSRAQIAAAGIALADADGLPAVSMRAVAAALGTGAGSLYRYLSSRDDLLDLMVDATLAELRLDAATGGSWLDDLVLLAREQRALYERHPWMLRTSMVPRSFGPQALRYLEHCLRVMAPLPSGTPAKLEAVSMITGVVFLFSQGQHGPHGEFASRAAFPTADPRDHPHLVAALGHPTTGGAREDLFERTLRSVLTGLLI